MPDPTLSEKIDSGLEAALRAHGESGPAADPDDGISVGMTFEGDLGAIEALGFETQSVEEGEARGIVRFKDVELLVAHPGVLWIAAGSSREPHMDTAAVDIRARARSVSSGSPVNGCWQIDPAGGSLTSLANATGKDVIVAVIDTGIDYTHPVFMSQVQPQKKTRILRIWDQGLSPTARSECPDVALLRSTQTYGVEYDDHDIETDLNGGTPILHRDCEGHGTHVASIAAGGPVLGAHGDARFLGVAPEASIIMVRATNVAGPVRFRTQTGFGRQVGDDDRMQDAIVYCLRTARQLGKSVVVNMSYGNRFEAGDALDSDARFADRLMHPSQAEGPLNFPRSAVLVKGAGNFGDLADRLVARIVVPSSGEITVPLELTDTRGQTQTIWRCGEEVYSPPVAVRFWYRRANPFTAVKFALRLPHQGGFSGDMEVGGFLDRAFIIRAGTPPRAAIVTSSNRVFGAFVRHHGEPAVPHPNGHDFVRRHSVEFWVTPKETAGTITYPTGIYEMRIKAPTDTEIFVMCGERFWARAKKVVFGIASTLANGDPLDSNIHVTSRFSATDTLGKRVITVAAYDDKDGATGPSQGEIWPPSSRGPLRNFSNPTSPLALAADKPDIAAPGVHIMAAKGRDSEPTLWQFLSGLFGLRFTTKKGTSMSAPIVSGVIALMLNKKPDLNIDEVRHFLLGPARAAVDPHTPPDSTEAYGSGMVDALQSHRDTT
jgi:subtilisin family serine protease